MKSRDDEVLKAIYELKRDLGFLSEKVAVLEGGTDKVKTNDFVCPACGLKVKSEHNLLVHIVGKHPEWIVVKSPYSVDEPIKDIVSENETMKNIVSKNETIVFPLNKRKESMVSDNETVDVMFDEIKKLNDDGGDVVLEEPPKKNLSIPKGFLKPRINWMDLLIGLFVTFLLVLGLLAVL